MMKKKKVSITQIADDLQIAPSSVSRALNDMPGVGDELRAQIKNHAQNAGYYDKAMKTAAGKKLNIIAMIVGDIRNPFYADLVFSVQKELNKHGYLLSVFNSEYNALEELNYMRVAELFNFSGIIQVTVTTEQMSKELKTLSIPVIMVNRMISSFETDVVLLDNYEAGYIATRYLIELGHSRIGFLLGQKESSSSRQRYDGYLQAMKNYNLEIDENDILQGDLTMETAYALAKEFVTDMKNRPTAMIISNDLAAHGFMTCCQEAGVEIPNMLSVVSFDNIRFFSAGSIPLTTIDPHVNEMGRIAANLMVERIKNPNKEKERVILNPILLERKSTLPFRETRRD